MTATNARGEIQGSDLIGFPIRIGIGEKSLAKGEVEIKLRGGGVTPVKPEEAVAKVLELIRGVKSSV